MYRLDNTSRLVTSGDAERIAKCVQLCRGIRPTVRSFDGTDPIQLLPFLKYIRITFNSQHLTEGVAVRVLALLLERDAKRLYTSYTMRGLCARQLHDYVSWLGLVNQFLKRYLTDDMLGEAYDAVATARQQSHETESTFADRLETAVSQSTAVFSEQSFAHYFVRGLAPATRAAVSETVQRLLRRQKTDLPTIRHIATAEGSTYRARRGLPLPDSDPAGRAGRTTKSAATSSPASTLHIREDERQADPVLITQGAGPVGGRPPSPMSTGTTSSYATAFAVIPRGARGTDPRVAELDISKRDTGIEAPRVPLLTDEEARHAATFASTDGSAYVCWLCRTYGHAMYACPFLSPEQRMFTAYRNYRYQMETRPGRINFSGRRSVRVVPRVKATQIFGEGAHASPHAEAGIAVANSIVVINGTTARRRQGTPAKEEKEGTETVLGYSNIYKTQSCTCKIGQRIHIPYPQKDTRENQFSLPLRSCDVRSSPPKVKKYSNTSPSTRNRSGGIVPPHAVKDSKETWPPIARRLTPIARVVRKKGIDGYVHAVT